MVKSILLSLGISSVILLTACSSASPEVSQEQITGFDSFITALEVNGSDVSLEGNLDQPFFSVPGQSIQLNGHSVQIFEYADEVAAQVEADLVSLDGSSVGASMIMWVEAPHFYSSGRLLVLYVGEDTGVLAALEAVLGPQFAGR